MQPWVEYDSTGNKVKTLGTGFFLELDEIGIDILTGPMQYHDLVSTPHVGPIYAPRDIVEVDKCGDPNHGRSGPVWSDIDGTGQVYDIWFEDGIRPYAVQDLNPTKEVMPEETFDRLPSIRPKA